ncbi:MAG: ABC transporter permease [Ilumatobacteraceae bacterium]
MTAVVDQAPAADPSTTRPSRRSRLLGDRLAYLPALLVLLVALIGPHVTPYSATDVVASPNIRPNGTHLMGTDSSGLDVFSRLLAGAFNDILIALATATVATATGIVIGLLIGMNESRGGILGLAARALARGIDLLQAVPAIVIALALVAFYGKSVPALIVSLTIILAPNQARLVRTEVLRVRSEAYLDAARMAGEREAALTLRHVLPNASWPALENASLVFGAAILITATLGFLGVGLEPPTPEWGSMISRGASDAAVGRWWPALFPALAMVVSVAAFSVAGHRAFGRR